MESKMKLIEDNWKILVKERFIEFKKQVNDIRKKYFKNDIDETLEHRTQEDDESIECEIIEKDEISNSDEMFRNDTMTVNDTSEIDAFTNLYHQIKNLEEKFFDENRNKIVNEQIYPKFGHLLLRTFHKIEMYFLHHDTDSQQFYENIEYIKNIFVKREKQLQRLIRSNVLSKYDYQMIEYETTLQQRESEHQNLDVSKINCLDIIDVYNRQCLHFHSTLNICGIYDNIDDIVKHFVGQKMNINDKERKALELALNNFYIPLNNPHIVCQKRPDLKQKQPVYFISQNINNLTMQEDEQIHVNFIDLIKSIRNDRWIVLLGGAGTGKTTFVRWLTCEFTRALFTKQKNVIIHDINMGPARIPILIRIGEFAQWLENHPNSSLLDYIGQHTWFGQAYVNEGFENLKDFVRYGHALIIFDGLDEVATIELHNRVVNLVRLFLETYCMSHEFVSPFDNVYMANVGLKSNFRREGLSGGNIVLITSRVLNYTSHPLNGELIQHYTIGLMSMEHLRHFVENWCYHVQDEIIHLFIQNLSDLNKTKTKCQLNLKPNILITKIETDNTLRLFASNPSILSIICTLFIRYGIDALEETRVQLYRRVVELMLQRWQNHQSNIHKDALMIIFSNMAFYIHSHSGSGLIDEFDLTHLCRLSLQRWYNKNKQIICYDAFKIQRQTEQFMQFISEDAGIVAARALCIYGFLHLTFQEYFVCWSLMNTDDSSVKVDIKELVDRLLSLFPNPRFGESLNLVMGWISLYWSAESYDEFCIELQSENNPANKHIPLGALWFANALNDLTCLPSLSIIHNILNTLLDAHIDENTEISIFEDKLMATLDQLPIAIVNSWLDQLFSKEDPVIILRILHILYQVIYERQALPRWFKPISCKILWKQFGLLSEEIDIYIDRILTIIGAIDNDLLPTPPGSMREYLLSRAIPISEIHSSIWAALIALYGGLERNQSKAKRQTSVVFAARRIHRDSPLSSLFIEYMDDTITERKTKLKRLTDKCQKILATVTSTNITPQMIHSLIVLFCIYSIDQSSKYEQYIGSKVWQHAVRHMKVVLLYLRELFCISPASKFKDNLTSIIEQFLIDSKENILDIAQSVSHAFCRLLRSKRSFLYRDSCMDGCNNLITIKIPSTINLLNLLNLKDDDLIKILPFICSLALSSAYDLTIDELESKDLDFLKEGIHPFQHLKNKPLILLLAYIPFSMQNLYKHLCAQNQMSTEQTSTLPFLHLLVEFLCAILMMQKYSIRFCVLLAILYPTLVQYRMENFLLLFLDTSKLKRSKQLYKAYNENYFYPFASIMKIGDYEEEKCFQESTIIEEQSRITNAQTDLQLYAASCCLASLKKDCYSWCTSNVSEITFDELWTKVQTIQYPVWRLDATINICCIFFANKKHEEMKNQLKDRYFSLIDSLEELEPTIPFLTYVALFVRSMTFIHKDYHMEKDLIYNILQRLKTVTIAEQQAICEALISFPSFHHIVSQHVRQSQYSENRVKLNEIFQSTSLTFSKYFSANLFSTHDIMKIHSTLLASMYLSELNSYLRLLDDSSTTQRSNHFLDILSSQSLAQKCLKTLEEEPIESLTVQAASMICSLLSSPIEKTDEIHIIQIQQSLMKKTNIHKSAYSFVFEWLNYRYDKRLCSFAYHGALLLGLSNMWTPTIIEIYCELLTNECDYLRDSTIKLICNEKWDFEKESINIFIEYLDRWNKKQSKCLSEIEYLFDTLDIQMIDEIERILELERNRFQKNIETKSITFDKKDNDCYEVSFFRLIKNISSEIQEHIVTVMQSLSNCLPDSTNFLFLYWLLEQISCKLFKDNEHFIQVLIGILRNSSFIKIKIAAARGLITFRENEQVQSVLWNIIINNEQEDSDEYVAVCIWSLFTRRQSKYFTKNHLKELNYLHKNTCSSLIRQMALAAMHLYIVTEPEQYDIVQLYYSYMINTSYKTDIYDENYSDDSARKFIIKYASVLLPQFIDDMYKSFHKASIFGTPAYEEIAARICVEIPNTFRDTVRQSSIGEDDFRRGLYEMSRKVNSSDQAKYLGVYACFEQVFFDSVTMLTTEVFKDSIGSLHIHQFRFVSERHLIELLFGALKSSLSLRRRYTIAQLLVNLAIFDQVSAVEVRDSLAAAIDDPWSHQFVDLHRKERVDWALRRLLLRLLNQPFKQYHCVCNIDMSNEILDDRIPTAVFQKKFNK